MIKAKILLAIPALGFATLPLVCCNNNHDKGTEYEIVISGTTEVKVKKQEIKEEKLILTLESTKVGKQIANITNIKKDEKSVTGTFDKNTSILTIDLNTNESNSLGKISFDVVMEFVITVSGKAQIVSQTVDANGNLLITLQETTTESVGWVDELKIGPNSLTIANDYIYSNKTITIKKAALDANTGVISLNVKTSIGKAKFLEYYATYLANFRNETKHYNLSNIEKCIYDGQDVTTQIDRVRYDYIGDQKTKTLNLLKGGSSFGQTIGGLTEAEMGDLIKSDGDGVWYEYDNVTNNITFTYTYPKTGKNVKKITINKGGLIIEYNDTTKSLSFSLQLKGDLENDTPSFQYINESGTGTKVKQRIYTWKGTGTMFFQIVFDNDVNTNKVSVTFNKNKLSPSWGSSVREFFIDVSSITGQEQEGFVVTYTA